MKIDLNFFLIFKGEKERIGEGGQDLCLCVCVFGEGEEVLRCSLCVVLCFGGLCVCVFVCVVEMGFLRDWCYMILFVFCQCVVFQFFSLFCVGGGLSGMVVLGVEKRFWWVIVYLDFRSCGLLLDFGVQIFVGRGE